MDRDAILESSERRLLSRALEHYGHFSKPELYIKLESFSALLAKESLAGKDRSKLALWDRAAIRALRHLALGEPL